MPRLRRTPLLVAAALAASTLAAVPVHQAISSERVVAQSESAITPIGIAPRLLSDTDYLAQAAADQRVARVAADAKAAKVAAEQAAAAKARDERQARLAKERRASRSSNRVAATGPVAYGSPRAIAKGQLAQRGWSDQFGCLDNLWTRESGWRTTAANSSGAYGIPQALPGSKMASEGSDWRTNPATQIRWGLGYIASRYGDPCGAWANFQNKGWY
ncbi:MAG: hypothetical protein ABIO67_07100 [Mycobacteriales bacterium]